MTHEEKENYENVEYRMVAEGFHYCFVSYSDFPEIKDEKFHQLRKAYIKAAEELRNYVASKVEEIEEDED